MDICASGEGEFGEDLAQRPCTVSDKAAVVEVEVELVFFQHVFGGFKQLNGRQFWQAVLRASEVVIQNCVGNFLQGKLLQTTARRLAFLIRAVAAMSLQQVLNVW